LTLGVRKTNKGDNVCILGKILFMGCTTEIIRFHCEKSGWASIPVLFILLLLIPNGIFLVQHQTHYGSWSWVCTEPS